MYNDRYRCILHTAFDSIECHGMFSISVEMSRNNLLRHACTYIAVIFS